MLEVIVRIEKKTCPVVIEKCFNSDISSEFLLKTPEDPLDMMLQMQKNTSMVTALGIK